MFDPSHPNATYAAEAQQEAVAAALTPDQIALVVEWVIKNGPLALAAIRQFIAYFRTPSA